MPRSPYGSSSPRTPTPRSGSNTRDEAPAAALTPVAHLPPAPYAPLAPKAPERKPAPWAWPAFAVAFVALHYAIGWIIHSPIRPRTLLPFIPFVFPVSVLLSEFTYFGSILLLAAFLGFGLRRPHPADLRFVILLSYTGSMVACILFVSELTAFLFEILILFAPVPAVYFLFAGRVWGWGFARLFAFTLIFFDFWRAIYGNLPELLVIAGGGGAPPASPAFDWYVSFFLKLLWDLIYVVLGLLLFFRALPGLQRPFRWGRILETVLKPIGAWVRRSPTVDLAWGSLLLVANLVMVILLSTFVFRFLPQRDVGDDSQVFTQILLDQVFLVSIMAGVAEELFFRGVLQTGLHRLLGGGRIAFFAALMVQGLAFGIVHAGYQTFLHFLNPLLFGLFMGLVFRYFGILAAILIHVEIDVFALGSIYSLTHPGPLMVSFLWSLLFANIAFPAIVLPLDFHRNWQRRRRELTLVAST